MRGTTAEAACCACLMMLVSKALEVEARAFDNYWMSIVRACLGKGDGVCDAGRGRGRFGGMGSGGVGMAEGEYALSIGDGEIGARCSCWGVVAAQGMAGKHALCAGDGEVDAVGVDHGWICAGW